MKQFDIKTEREIDGNVFYIRPFAAMTATNISGELASIVTPLLSGLLPLIKGAGDSADVLDVDAAVAAPALSGALSSLSGDKIESLLNKLLLKYENISVLLKGENEAVKLDKDILNEVFCGEVQDMFILAFEVIKANFSGFFKKLGGRFGALASKLGM